MTNARHPRWYRALLVMTVAIVMLPILGCSTGEPSDAPPGDGVLGVEEAVVMRPPLPEADRVIGVHELGDGRVRAVGLIQYRAKEGASWCLVEGTPGEEPPADAPVIVVIANMADLDAVCSTSGALAYAEGVLIEDDGSYPGQPMNAEFVARAD